MACRGFRLGRIRVGFAFRRRVGGFGHWVSLASTDRDVARRRPVSRTWSALLFDLGFLAAQLSQVVELGAPHITAGHDLDVVDIRRMQREGSLHAYAVALLAHREG